MRLPPPPNVRSCDPGDRGLEYPSVLLVGAPTAYQAALAGMLDARGHFVELTPRHALIRVATALAPDLIVLLEDSAEGCGVDCLEQLAGVRACAPIPVMVLAEPEDLAERLRAYRLGARAVMRRPASVDAAAAAVSRLVRALPGAGLGELEQVGEVTLDELTQAFGSTLRDDVLGVIAGGGHEPPVRLLLDEHEPILSLISEFVQRLRPHVVRTEAMEAEDLPDAGESASPPQAARVLLVDDDTTRADVVAQELRARGVRVLVTGTDPSRQVLLLARQLVPQAILVDSGCLAGERTPLLALLWRDVELRWATLVTVRWREIWPDPLKPATVGPLLAGISEATAPDRLLVQRIQSSTSLVVRLEVTGPVRLLQALERASCPLRLTVSNRRVEVQVDVANRLIAGATAHSVDGPAWTAEGPPALAALLQLGSGRVRIERVENPATVNLLCPLELALAIAETEPAPIRASRIDDIEAFDGRPFEEGTSPGLESNRPTAISARPFLPPGGAGNGPGRVRRLGEKLGRVAVPLFVLAMLGFAATASVAAFSGARATPGAATAAKVTVASVPLAVGGPMPAGTSAAATVSGVDGPSARGANSEVAGPPAPIAPAGQETAEGASTRSARALSPRGAGSGSPLEREADSGVPSCDELEAPTAEPASSFDAVLARAQRAVVAGNLPAARAAYCDATRLAPDQPSPWLSLTRVLLMEGDGRSVRRVAEQALRLAPSSVLARELLGDALARSGAPELAKREWFRARGVDARAAEEVSAWVERQREIARQAAAAQRYELSERACIRVIVLEPADVGAAYCVSRALTQRNAHERALAWATHARRLAGNDPEKIQQATGALGSDLVARGRSVRANDARR